MTARNIGNGPYNTGVPINQFSKISINDDLAFFGDVEDEEDDIDYLDYVKQNVEKEKFGKKHIEKQVMIDDDKNENESPKEYIVEKVLSHRFNKGVSLLCVFFLNS
jgi:hypothetical protein